MFNRRFLRVKIFQALYAYLQSEEEQVSKQLSELQLSIDRTFDLLLFILNLPAELKQKGELRLEEALKKELPSEEDLNPNRKFVDNRVIKMLMESKKLAVYSNSRQISWSDQQENVSRFYKFMRESKVYLDFMNSGKNSYAEDKNMIVSLIKEVLPKFDSFRNYFHEKSIYWDEEDFDYATVLVSNIIRKTNEGRGIDDLIHAPSGNKDDKDFVDQLFKKTISSDKETEELIMSKAANWDAERIAFIDMILMKMAITEIMNFSSIPVKVSINEYIDISKFFSSPKSGQFINGIVDKVIEDLIEKKKFRKIGRGLMN